MDSRTEYWHANLNYAVLRDVLSGITSLGSHSKCAVT